MKGARSIPTINTAFTDPRVAFEDLEAEGFAVVEVLLPAVEAGVVPEAVAVFDIPLEDMIDDADELAEVLDTDEDDDDAGVPLEVSLPAE